MSRPIDRLRNIQDAVALTKTSISIGDATLNIQPPKNPEFVPHVDNVEHLLKSQTVLSHLRWMIQKGNLKQDMFLIGAPGPFKLALALIYAQLAQREIEYISITRDTTDGDLKQRREIRDGNAVYFDQGCVRAAIEGRLLILDGVEKAERNVLPILNNLLENREMALEDGRFLVHPKRFDEIMQSSANEGDYQKFKLVKVSEHFLVIALGSPVPKYEGFPLDPPFRSRFQARSITHFDYQTHIEYIKSLFPSVQNGYIKNIISVANVIQNVDHDQGAIIIDFPTNLEGIFKVLNSVDIDPRFVIQMCYPLPYISSADHQMKNTTLRMLERFQLFLDPNSVEFPIHFVRISQKSESVKVFKFTSSALPMELELKAGRGKITYNDNYIRTP
ncbi:hypothetical protein HDV01_005318 [Terramyces sp. JEL0728]|nr:hypothetical protein HDV01_005318 [Terramyces sp. JEL0728]